MSQPDWVIWSIIAGLGAGTYLIRLSFLGLLGGRELPPWVLRHLRYTAVGVIPALIAPLILWPEVNGGEPEPARLSAAAVTLVIGYTTRNVLFAVLAGMGTLYTVIAFST